MHDKNVISVELLKINAYRLWIMGLSGLLLFANFLTRELVRLPVRLIAIWAISWLFYLPDFTIHEFIKDINANGILKVQNDYPWVISEYLHGLAKESLFKES